MTVRVAGAADVDAVVATITTAFFHDPLWGPAFPDVARRHAQASAFWRFLVTASLRHGWTLVTPDVEAAAVWIPPGAVELTTDEEAALETLLEDTVGRPVADDIHKIFEIFEAAHPHEPHSYLSLLGTHDAHRGKGLGMALLRESLARIDEAGHPAYLESSNPANDARYASVGFVPHAPITAPTGQTGPGAGGARRDGRSSGRQRQRDSAGGRFGARRGGSRGGRWGVMGQGRRALSTPGSWRPR